MIDAKVEPAGKAFAAALAQKASLLAQGYGESLGRARAYDPARWRVPGLLWRLF